MTIASASVHLGKERLQATVEGSTSQIKAQVYSSVYHTRLGDKRAWAPEV